MSDVRIPTENDLLTIKRKAEAGKEKYISAKSTLKEVQKNIADYEIELEEMGVDPANVDDFIEKKESEIAGQYAELLEMIPSEV
jgi:hypothetical protein